MRKLILSAACMMTVIFANATVPASVTTEANKVSAVLVTSDMIVMPMQVKPLSRSSVLDKLKLDLDQSGNTFIAGKCEKMVYYIPSTG